MRVRVGRALGGHGAFAHTDPNALSADFVGVTSPAQPLAHAEWLDSAHAKWLRKGWPGPGPGPVEGRIRQANRSGQLPVWVVTEILNFGSLSRLYEGSKENDRDDIAAGFNEVAGIRWIWFFETRRSDSRSSRGTEVSKFRNREARYLGLSCIRSSIRPYEGDGSGRRSRRVGGERSAGRTTCAGR